MSSLRHGFLSSVLQDRAEIACVQRDVALTAHLLSCVLRDTAQIPYTPGIHVPFDLPCAGCISTVRCGLNEPRKGADPGRCGQQLSGS